MGPWSRSRRSPSSWLGHRLQRLHRAARSCFRSVSDGVENHRQVDRDTEKTCRHRSQRRDRHRYVSDNAKVCFARFRLKEGAWDFSPAPTGVAIRGRSILESVNCGVLHARTVHLAEGRQEKLWQGFDVTRRNSVCGRRCWPLHVVSGERFAARKHKERRTESTTSDLNDDEHVKTLLGVIEQI